MSEPGTDPCDMSKVKPSESFFFLHLNSKLSLSPLYLAGNQSEVALPLSRGKVLSALLITSPGGWEGTEGGKENHSLLWLRSQTPHHSQSQQQYAAGVVFRLLGRRAEAVGNTVNDFFCHSKGGLSPFSG